MWKRKIICVLMEDRGLLTDVAFCIFIINLPVLNFKLEYSAFQKEGGSRTWLLMWLHVISEIKTTQLLSLFSLSKILPSNTVWSDFSWQPLDLITWFDHVIPIKTTEYFLITSTRALMFLYCDQIYQTLLNVLPLDIVSSGHVRNSPETFRCFSSGCLLWAERNLQAGGKKKKNRESERKLVNLNTKEK